jgi:PAS domain-containing protein
MGASSRLQRTVEGRRQKNLILILARELASKLATATFIADADGELVFYNEPAEEILGRPFAEAGELSAETWTSLFHPETLDGQPMALTEMPSGIALLERRPAHDIFRITCLDGRTRVVSVTGVPLFAQADRFVGMLAIFWEQPEARES